MKYIDKEQVVKLILKSSIIYIYTDTLIAQFIGITLEKCEMKLPIEILEEITFICDLLEIEYRVINKSY